MFGYVVINRKELSKEELNKYKSYYCGLCNGLEEKYGKKETERVYREVSNIIREQFNKFNTLDEPLPGQMSFEDLQSENN